MVHSHSRTLRVAALFLVVLLHGTQAHAFLEGAVAWFLSEVNTVNRDYPAESLPPGHQWRCHPQVELVSAGARDGFRIEVTGLCGLASAPELPGSHPEWKPAKLVGTYDPATGRATEVVTLSGPFFVMYDLAFQCQPNHNPFLYTGACTTAGGTGAGHPVVGPLPLIGPRLPGPLRQRLIDFVAEQGAHVDDEMDLAPKLDPPTFVQPTNGQGFPKTVRIQLAPGRNALTTVFLLEFRRKTGLSALGSSGWARIAGAETIDTERQPQGLYLAASRFPMPGTWQVRARMNTSGASFGAPVEFGVAVGVDDIAIAPVVPGPRAVDSLRPGTNAPEGSPVVRRPALRALPGIRAPR